MNMARYDEAKEDLDTYFAHGNNNTLTLLAKMLRENFHTYNLDIRQALKLEY